MHLEELIRREERKARAEGLQKGREEGLSRGLEQGLSQGLSYNVPIDVDTLRRRVP